MANYRSALQIASGSTLYFQLLLCFCIGLILTYKQQISIGVFISSLLFVEYVSSCSYNIVDELLEIKNSRAYENRYHHLLAKVERPKLYYCEPGGLLSVTDVSYSYRGKKLLGPFSASFTQGKKYLLTGKNGSGKSTFLKMLAGLLAPSTGTIRYPKGYGKQEHPIGYIPQDRYLFEGTILENILLFGEADQEKLDQITQLMLTFHLQKKLSDPVEKGGSNLSGGEKAKICLIRGLLDPCDLLLVDEPFNDVDADSQTEILDYLLHVDSTLVLVSHGLNNDLFDHELVIG